MEANFTGPNYTLGVEEELMILDGETFALANEIEAVVAAYEGEGEVKPELLQSRARDRHAAVRGRRARPAATCGALRREVSEAAGRHGLAIGSAGTHPFALWEDQRVSADPRYRDLIAALRFIARQEIIFGLHVHVGIDDPDKAIHVANGMRVHVPILLALSANSPVLARGRDRPRLDADADLPRLPARRHPALLRGLGRLRAPHRASWSRRA